ncbi:MAG: RNA polymerase sigma factor [bacterium]|nr:RNA polymerase sigma factor [bacterium]MDZ4231377.1 RNA polymerase sigma factor [Patescibacteria group bacterium]
MDPKDTLKVEFTRAYDEYADAIFRHCYFRISDRERAKDLMQETFIKTWDYILKHDERIDNLRAFLYKTAHNLVVDEYRKAKGNASLETMQEDGFQPGVTETITDSVGAKLESEYVLKVVEKIDGKYREAVIMRYMDGLTPKEIAKITGETQNNISVRINRGLKQLREILENDEEQ